jgi:hypothetical protein
VLDDDREVICLQRHLRLNIKSGLRLSSPFDSYTQRCSDLFLSLYDRLHHIKCHVCDSTDRMEARYRGILSHRLFRRIFSGLHRAYSTSVRILTLYKTFR